MSAICIKCGGTRARYDQICPSCGLRPEGESLLVAWLLSSENLSSEELSAAAERVRTGESIRPSRRMIDRARKALGKHFMSDPGLTTKQRVALLATSLFLTPLPGWVLGLWWRNQRPRAAIQALALSAPATVLFTALVLGLNYMARG